MAQRTRINAQEQKHNNNLEVAQVLEGFYKDNNLALVQKEKQPVTGMDAGDAPPPPPPTWEGGYGGKTGESQGIVAIMEMVHEGNRF